MAAVTCIVVLCGAILALAQGQTASDRVQVLETLVNQLVQRVSQLEAQVTQLTNGHRRVAFSAITEGSHAIHAVQNGVLVFSVPIDNVGGAYNPVTGEFIAPYDGDYFFTVGCDVSEDYEGLRGYARGQFVFKADKDDTVSTHVQGSIVVKMTAGDIFVHRHVSSRGTVHSGHESVLSGFLIQ